ncbi:MAG: molybdenum cofactor biosynthesis protein A [Terrestrivirus sp.]|uniref:Molybdenum cofactor biosynthesis protein A n=1 Tax=Terrestrivirus sp. TaxID=2487775 RepID=A0A3G4ZL20_9VIRU|nr:MAG: molybdenum cofactor biosynthesis protein A [Terrestrivirus sp.]
MLRFDPQRFTRTASALFKQYKLFNETLIAKSPRQFIRLDCMNPVKSIKPLLNPIEKTPIDIMKTYLFINSLHDNKNILLYNGVRHSLYNILSIFPGKTITMPSDAYPVYQHIARNHNMIINNVRTLDINQYNFDYINRLIKSSNEAKSDIILLPIPFHPHGYHAKEQDINKLVSWLKEKSSRIVIVDRVYSYDNKNNKDYDLIKLLTNTDQVFVCESFSKSLLSPNVLGMTYAPTRFTELDKIIYELNLDSIHKTLYNANFAAEQPNLFKTRWDKIGDALTKLFPQHISRWKKPENGYMSVFPVSFNELLDKGVLAVPSQVFSNNSDCDVFDLNKLSESKHSIITCLYDNDTERKKYYVTLTSNFCKGYDKYSRTYDKSSIPESTFKDKFFLTSLSDVKVGIAKNAKRAVPMICMEYNVPYNIPIQKNDKGFAYIESTKINVDNVYIVEADSMNIKSSTVEDIYAASIANIHAYTNNLKPYNELIPRTISFLPVSKGCQAKCPFCFSHGSISDDQEQKNLSPQIVERLLQESFKKGAERAVITGGGEPMMLPFDRLCNLIKQCNNYFRTVVMITNGYALGKLDSIHIFDDLQKLQKNGLTVLSVSRHGYDDTINKKIMHLDTKSDRIGNVFKTHSDMFDKMRLRWVCVLQKNGVDSAETLNKYLDWVVENGGASEICFKELYVSTSIESVYHDTKTNQWSRENRVPLSLLVNYLEKRGGKIVNKLPWGSPIYEFYHNGKKLKIAAYTEPNVYWERSEGICRSWNVMSDGKCYASLEDKNSLVN